MSPILHPIGSPCRNPNCDHLIKGPGNGEANGYCSRCYKRLGIHGSLSNDVVKWTRLPSPFPYGQMPETCIKDGCNRPAVAQGLCNTCYKRRYYRKLTHGNVKELCPICHEREYQVWRRHDMCFRCWAKRPKGSGRIGKWDREMVLAAGREWIRLTGYAPRSTDWQSQTRHQVNGKRGKFPSARQVYRIFDTWDNFQAKLGGVPPRPSRQGQGSKGRTKHIIWTPEICIQSGLAYVDVYDKLPGAEHWQKISRGLGLPALATIQHKFGSWSAFKDALQQYDDKADTTSAS